MNRTREEWSKVSPAAVAGGSYAQAVNVMAMMLQDIETLHQELDELRDPRCKQKLDSSGYCAACGWDAKTRSYRKSPAP